MQKLTNLLLLIQIAVSFSCTAQPDADQRVSEQTQPDKPRYQHTADLARLVPKFVAKNGMGYDSLFTVAVSQPMEHMYHFFGLQAVKTLNHEVIKSDFVSQDAELVSEDSMRLVLDFPEIGKTTFYINTSLVVQNNEVPVDHIEFPGETWQEVNKNVDTFIELLERKGLTDKYLLENPLYIYEQQVYNRMTGNQSEAPIEVRQKSAVFSDSEPTIYIIPDPVHGDSATFFTLYETIDELSPDWLGLEMLTDTLQSVINTYLSESETTDKFKQAEEKLQSVYSTAWKINVNYEEEGNPWLKLFRLAKEKDIAVVGLEMNDLTYLIFRYGENKFGGAVRNVVWASHIPDSGNGIVFGGKLHFTHPAPIDFQDFVIENNPSYQLVATEEID